MKHSKLDVFAHNSSVNKDLLASKNIILNANQSKNNYALTFKGENGETFPLGDFFGFKDLSDLEEKLKHNDYHLLNQTNRDYGLVLELLKSSAFEKAVNHYKNAPNKVVIENGFEKIRKRDDNDALVFAINIRKSNLLDELLYLSNYDNKKTKDELYSELDDLSKIVSSHDRSFYAETLLMLKENVFDKVNFKLYALPLIERTYFSKLDDLLEKEAAWKIINFKAREFKDVVGKDLEFNDGVLKDSFVYKALTRLDSLYEVLIDISNKASDLMGTHLNVLSTDFADASLIKRKNIGGLKSTRDLINKKYSAQRGDYFPGTTWSSKHLTSYFIFDSSDKS